MDKLFDAVGKLKYLPRVNAELKDSVEIINNRRALASDSRDWASAYEIDTLLGEIRAKAQDVSNLAGKLGEASSRLDSAINAFVTSL